MEECYAIQVRQLSFLPSPRREYVPQKGKRKIRRPFDPKRALHVTLSSTRARGTRSLLQSESRLRIQALMLTISERHEIRIYRFANVGNHIHFLLGAKRREDLRAFLREFAGAVAVAVTGAAKGRPEKFWDCPPWSKIIEWGRQFARAKSYVLLNVLESSGLRDRALLTRLERDGIIFIHGAPAPS
jgi:REP element-mobilizing transposase RayT